MVAWLMEFFTPEYPNGRKAIVIGNDITHVIGSFGPQEDRVRSCTATRCTLAGWPAC